MAWWVVKSGSTVITAGVTKAMVCTILSAFNLKLKDQKNLCNSYMKIILEIILMTIYSKRFETGIHSKCLCPKIIQ